MLLECFSLMQSPPEIVPGRPERDWMDAFHMRFPYRCLPLTMANASGWEILCPSDVSASWNGGNAQSDIVIETASPHLVHSHFSHGVLTFHTGYLFRTPPGISLWVSGAPNLIKDGIQPLTGLVETEWLAFPFTMNWRFTRPGTVRFFRDEPFCFIQPIEHKKLDEVVPVLKHIDDEPELKRQFDSWSTSRRNFNNNLATGAKEAITQGWQRHYFRGQTVPVDDESPSLNIEGHINKRRLRKPI
ncbi:DUF6065 family protein [Brucella intermedia]|uniref:DUF6065 family protein n=1 Tax=Brucella intermedia TaxID=94625 RepID=UPI00124D01F4|nr:DUF6065 family protein [Brucella intermedia]KAB2725344.1 hypothetical protein F9L02_20255 [Brucella intermedia]